MHNYEKVDCIANIAVLGLLVCSDSSSNAPFFLV